MDRVRKGTKVQVIGDDSLNLTQLRMLKSEQYLRGKTFSAITPLCTEWRSCVSMFVCLQGRQAGTQPIYVRPTPSLQGPIPRHV